MEDIVAGGSSGVWMTSKRPDRFAADDLQMTLAAELRTFSCLNLTTWGFGTGQNNTLSGLRSGRKVEAQDV